MKLFALILIASILSSARLQAAELFPRTNETLPAQAKDGLTRALLIGGGSSHDFETYFHHADSATLKAAGNIAAAYTGNLAEALEVMSNADVIVLSANHGQFGTPEFQSALNAFADAGHGLVVLHAATWHNWKNAPVYNQRFVGGGAASHSVGDFSVFNRQPGHPVMQDVPADFKITDELYHVTLDFPATVEVLAETQVEAESGRAYPSVWVVKDPKARIVDIALGHAAEAHGNPAFQKLLVNSVRWVGGKN